MNPPVNTTIVIKQKSMGIALILAFLFGPLGMLYSTVAGGIVMFIISIPVVLFTGGLGLLLTIPLGMVWAAMAVNGYNKQLMRR